MNPDLLLVITPSQRHTVIGTSAGKHFQEQNNSKEVHQSLVAITLVLPSLLMVVDAQLDFILVLNILQV
jgi:hypothetical protein